MPLPGTRAEAVRALLRGALDDPEAAWSLGGFGAVAEFVRGPGEPCTRTGDLALATARGAISFDRIADLVPVAYETALGGAWNHAVALCLPAAACAMGRRGLVAELGPDAAAVRARDRGGILFDLGLGLPQVDACLRTSDTGTVARLRSGVGRPFDPELMDPNLAPAEPHRVLIARCGRVEVFGTAPPAAAGSEGPRLRVAPPLLRSGRTHAATAPIPDGLVPCAHLRPAHPCRDGSGRPIPFDRARHDAFQALYRIWGRPDHVRMKARLLAGGQAPPGRLDRHGRAVAKVAAIQAARLRDPP